MDLWETKLPRPAADLLLGKPQSCNGQFPDLKDFSFCRSQAQNATVITLESDQSFRELVGWLRFYIEGIGILTFGVTGLIINVFALYILFKKQVRRRTMNDRWVKILSL